MVGGSIGLVRQIYAARQISVEPIYTECSQFDHAAPGPCARASSEAKGEESRSFFRRNYCSRDVTQNETVEMSKPAARAAADNLVGIGYTSCRENNFLYVYTFAAFLRNRLLFFGYSSNRQSCGGRRVQRPHLDI